MVMTINWEALQAPFPSEDIEWRLQSCGKKGEKIWAICLAYVTNRAIMSRLDEVLTPAGWQNKFETGPHGGVICGISIKVDGEWITKWDGAENTQVEAVKGGLSDAMKRAGYQWGIGRYLYDLEEGFAKVHDNGKHRGKTKENASFNWDPPELPTWALPKAAKEQGKTPGQRKEKEPDAIKNPPQRKEPATDEQLAKITDICMVLSDKTLKTPEEILKEISTFPGSNGDVWLKMDTLKAQCSKGWAGRAIAKGEQMLRDIDDDIPF